MVYRDTTSFGKRQEYRVVAQLLRRGFDVYMTLVDDQGIDCVLCLDERRYLDIQIKAGSSKAKQWNFFAAMSFPARPNLYFSSGVGSVGRFSAATLRRWSGDERRRHEGTDQCSSVEAMVG